MEAWTKDNDNAVDINIHKLKLKLKLTDDVTQIYLENELQYDVIFNLGLYTY